MLLRSLFVAAILALGVAPETAQAWSSNTRTNLIIRNGPGTGYGRLTVIPAGDTVEVYRCAGWCEVYYKGHRGWVFGEYLGYAPLTQTLNVSPVGTRHGTRLKPVYVPPQAAYLASAPIRSPSEERVDWYAGRAMYFNGRYVDRPDVFFVYGR
ncbi:MAG: SH3 domain-containing protein [Bauldia sp.]|uniref:SH3 domain-containing protein n=1 Tax=Bauldia sp. TaxID=2575872 RepID=UPI001DDF7D4E|nr:SH3 domain-containing protein [Bauldia sp.]MCB1496048.1 SH3 domain-containing protein [Bauldia sp.]